MAVSVHYYSPAGFAILEEDADWGKAVPTWGSEEDYASLRSEMAMMKEHFTDRGIPVIIGEYGCPTKNKEPESVRRFLSSVCEEAYKCGHCPVMWSTPGGHYNRETCKMEDQELQRQLYAIGGKEFHPAGQTDGPVKGDLNGDGTVGIADAVLMQQHLLCIQPLKDGSGDLNGDRRINAVDFALLKRILVQQAAGSPRGQ